VRFLSGYNRFEMQRRQFIKFCAASAAVSPPALAAADASPRLYARAKLVDEDGKPLAASAVPANRNLVFDYPYVATPCFLLNLGRPLRESVQLRTADHRSYEWQGGVGAQRSIVAYSAICAHKLTYPTHQISFISYRAEASEQNRHARVIHCCSEHSQYDPARGGRVVAGPAPQPLAAILLDYDPADDSLSAIGTLGGEMFRQFFDKFRFRLAMEIGPSAQRAVSGSAVVTPLEHYCRQQVKC
jgi:arsenite oxidase small subunit